MQSDKPTGQWLSPDILVSLLKDVTLEFKEESYNINKVIRRTMEFLGQDKKHTFVHDQIMIFSQLLGGSPKYFVDLLNEEILSSQTHIITLNSRNTEVAKRLFQDFQQMLKIKEPQNYHLHSSLYKATITFINIVAKRFSFLYQLLVDKTSEKMEQLVTRVKKSRMMNNFLLYKIFRELAETIKKQTIDICISSLFRFCQLQTIEEFYKYTINKFQSIKLFASMDIQERIFEPSPTIFLESMEKSIRVEIILREAVRQDGKYALFIKLESSHSELKKSLDDYLLFLQDETLRMINCKTVRKKWFIIGDINYNFKLQKMARQYLVQGQFKVNNKKKDSQKPIENLFQSKPLQNFTNLDGVIGRCLYLMKRYNSPSDFFKDLSKRAILSKSLEEIMMVIPIVGFLIVAGSFTKAFYEIFSNHFSTDSKKLTEITGFVIKTGATVGTSILGAFVGQALIPIPVVGALVGTVVGGFLGQRGCRSVTSMISQSRFDELINYFRINLKDNRRWQLNQELYGLLQVKKKSFQNYIPKYMEKDVFVTIIGFVVVCFHESTRLVKHNKEKQKIEEQKEKEKAKKKKYMNEYQKEKEFQDEVFKLSQSDGFKTEFDLNAIIQYLQSHNGQIYEHYDVLEKSILSFLSKIIP